MELRLATRLNIGRRLAEDGQRKIKLRDVAVALGVTDRTLRNWRAKAKKDVPKMGRPSASQETLYKARELVFEEMERQGSPGWRPVAAALKGKVSVRHVQKFVAEFKLLKRKRRTPSKRTRVFGKNIVWSMDGAITKENGKKVENQVIKDRGTLRWVGERACETASKASDVIEILSASFKANGKPLVLSTDNGSAYKSREVRRFLEEEKVIHLMSLPRTPQHNGSVEVGIRELKSIGKNAGCDLKVATQIANVRLRKIDGGWSTAESMYQNAELSYTSEDRAVFFESCRKRLINLSKVPLGFRQRRMFEREVVFEELENRNLITRWKR